MSPPIAISGKEEIGIKDDTIVYEYKTGPYEGQEYDKTFI